MTKGKGVQSVEREHQKADPDKSPRRTYPEQSSERRLGWQGICFSSTALHSPQYQGWNPCGDEVGDLFQQHRPQATRAEVSRRRQFHGEHLQGIKHSYIESESPSRTQAVWA